MRSLIAVLALLVAVPALAVQTETTLNSPVGGYSPPEPGLVYQWERVVLYDNGPVYNGAYSTYFESILQSSLLMNSYGYNCSSTTGYRVADDFEVPVGDMWDVDSVTLFAYQTNAGTGASTFTSFFVRIWKDGPPDVGTLIWGDLVTNRLATSVWSNVHRTLEGSHSTARPIFANTCTVDVMLPPGQYWLEWECAGTLASGPWAPPIAILGQTTTGDALQWQLTAWAYIVDSGSLTNQGLPFIVEGTHCTAVENATWGGIKALFQ